MGNTAKISAGGRACSLVLALVTPPHFTSLLLRSPEKKGLVRVGGVGDVFCTSV